MCGWFWCCDLWFGFCVAEKGMAPSRPPSPVWRGIFTPGQCPFPVSESQPFNEVCLEIKNDEVLNLLPAGGPRAGLLLCQCWPWRHRILKDLVRAFLVDANPLEQFALNSTSGFHGNCQQRRRREMLLQARTHGVGKGLRASRQTGWAGVGLFKGNP